MQTVFTITGIVLGALTGFKTGAGGWMLVGFIGLVIELIVGSSIIHLAHTSAPPWAAGIGGFILGNAVGSLAHLFAKS
ncbi:MAG: hypothetical protein ACYC67_09285 [Prosthecobacter sp.]